MSDPYVEPGEGDDRITEVLGVSLRDKTFMYGVKIPADKTFKLLFIQETPPIDVVTGNDPIMIQMYDGVNEVHLTISPNEARRISSALAEAADLIDEWKAEDES